MEENVRRSIAALRASPYIPHRDEVLGFVYDLEAPRLVEVDPG